MKQAVYQIRVKGLLNDSWSEWFNRWTVTPKKDGTTVLTGPVADQAALHGLLAKIRNLNLYLVSVNRLHPDQLASEQED